MKPYNDTNIPWADEELTWIEWRFYDEWNKILDNHRHLSQVCDSQLNILLRHCEFTFYSFDDFRLLNNEDFRILIIEFVTLFEEYGEFYDKEISELDYETYFLERWKSKIEWEKNRKNDK